MVVPRTSFNICFRFKVAKEKSNAFNLDLRNRLYQEGTSLVGAAYIDGQLVMRLLISNPAAERADIDNFFNNVVKTGRALLPLNPHEEVMKMQSATLSFRRVAAKIM